MTGGEVALHGRDHVRVRGGDVTFLPGIGREILQLDGVIGAGIPIQADRLPAFGDDGLLAAAFVELEVEVIVPALRVAASQQG